MGGNGYRHKNTEAGGGAAPFDQLTRVASAESLQKMQQSTKDWRQNLDQYQKTAIKTYINHGYTEMNQHLRNGGKMDDLNAPTEIQDLQDALMSARTGEKALVYRGIEDSMTKQEAAALIGQQAIEKGFTSTSMDFITGYQFTGPKGPGEYHVMRQITIPQNSRAGYVGGAEKELILPANARFQYTGFKVANYKDPVTGTSEKILMLQATYLGPKGLRGRPRKA